ncbi:hypothetical protein [Streptomyces sp. TLI_105]|uniref:hypothetical protein n=1 Tax=Streptomyces sp. TLI_105 TaxID=1881019 RepID=UPI000B8155AF|nr:hypothetical protein [Streptomyces sp. TLI_105]
MANKLKPNTAANWTAYETLHNLAGCQEAGKRLVAEHRGRHRGRRTAAHLRSAADLEQPVLHRQLTSDTSHDAALQLTDGTLTDGAYRWRIRVKDGDTASAWTAWCSFTVRRH